MAEVEGGSGMMVVEVEVGCGGGREGKGSWKGRWHKVCVSYLGLGGDERGLLGLALALEAELAHHHALAHRPLVPARTHARTHTHAHASKGHERACTS